MLTQSWWPWKQNMHKIQGFLANKIPFFFSDPSVARSEVVSSLTGFISVLSGLQNRYEIQRVSSLHLHHFSADITLLTAEMFPRVAFRAGRTGNVPHFTWNKELALFPFTVLALLRAVTQWMSWRGDSQTFPLYVSFPPRLAPWIVYIFIQSQLSKYIWINRIFLCIKLHLIHWSVVPCPRQGC